jgi:D-alanine-D-alanine ligase
MCKEEKSRQRVAVLFGGPNDEYEVSCHSAANVIRSLDSNRFNVTPIRISRAGVWIVGEQITARQNVDVDGLLYATRDAMLGPDTAVGTSLSAAIRALDGIDVLFPVLHGPYGEDGTIQALLELVGIRYVGNGIFASAAGMDKQQTKRLLAAEGLTVADGIVLEQKDATVDDRTRARLGLPVFVKPARNGSSIGVTKVNRWADLDAALELARHSDNKVLIEQAVQGREVDVAVLQYPDGDVVSGPPLEIVLPKSAKFFDHDAKYNDPSVEFRIPADLEPQVATLLRELAIQVFRILGCNGLLRVDFFLRLVGNRIVPVVNEVNTMPGLTAKSQYPQIWKAAGIDYSNLLTILIDTALATDRPTAKIRANC